MLSSSNDIFYYKTSYVGQHSVFNHPHNKPFGVTHADDIQYVLDTHYVGPLIDIGDVDNVMVERMTRIWEQFAKNGDPNNSTMDYLNEMVWPKYDTKNEYYLDIGTHLIEKQGLNLERFIVWDKVISDADQLKLAHIIVALHFIVILLKLA
jgi:carboxylesterase type B